MKQFLALPRGEGVRFDRLKEARARQCQFEQRAVAPGRIAEPEHGHQGQARHLGAPQLRDGRAEASHIRSGAAMPGLCPLEHLRGDARRLLLQCRQGIEFSAAAQEIKQLRGRHAGGMDLPSAVQAIRFEHEAAHEILTPPSSTHALLLPRAHAVGRNLQRWIERVQLVRHRLELGQSGVVQMQDHDVAHFQQRQFLRVQRHPAQGDLAAPFAQGAQARCQLLRRHMGLFAVDQKYRARGDQRQVALGGDGLERERNHGKTLCREFGNAGAAHRLEECRFIDG
ncbi:MAG: hypothetical protein V4582_01025 [Pseudomonadota bacterium]